MIEFLIIVFTVMASGFFSGSEIAFVSANRLKLEIESRKNSFLARSISFFNEKPETFLTTTLVGNNIINVLYATLMAIFLVKPIQIYHMQWFGSEPTTVTILLFQTIIASIIIMVFGEILPKAIFRTQADFFIKVIAVPLRIINFLLLPLISIANSSSNVLIKLLKTGEGESVKDYRRQDIQMIFNELRDSGGGEDFDEDETEILHNVLELSNKRVKETMVPRTEIVAIDKQADIDELQTIFITSGYSKIPVYSDSIDDIIGVVFAHDLFHNPKTISEIIRPVKLIPSSKKSKDLLTEFRQSNSSVAIVIDEYGGTAGMVTIEDLIEEVVGDIQDEYDTENMLAKKITDGTFIFSGNIELEYLEEKFPEIQFSKADDEFETVAGYIINQLGRIPKVNEEIIISGNKFIISKATQSRLETVKLILGSDD